METPKIETIYDVIVIGGGPAGMMSAGVASQRGLKVLLLEKNDILGKKLLITGGGRCNITNAEYDTRKFLGHLGDSGKFLFSTFSQFDVKATFEFFESRGLELKVEDRNRAFPADDKSSSVLNVLSAELRGVTVKTGSNVSGFDTDGAGLITAVRFANGAVAKARSFILATGGTSHPETGSTGDGYSWLREIGHTVVVPEPSLVPIAIQEAWVKALSGIALDNVRLSAVQNDKKLFSKSGRLLFTHFGVSGPTVINMSKGVGDALKYGPVSLSLDLFPGEDYGVLNAHLQDVFEKNKNKLFKNCLGDLVPSGFVETLVGLSGIAGDTPVHSVTREERVVFVTKLKDIRMTVSHLLGPEKSIVTSGGVDCAEVDFKTMHSRLYKNLAFAGDILNIERPSGGFSLQICWSTGFVSGSHLFHN